MVRVAEGNGINLVIPLELSQQCIPDKSPRGSCFLIGRKENDSEIAS